MNNYQEVGLEINKFISSLEEKTFDHFKSKLNELSSNISIKETDESNLVVLSNTFTKSELPVPLTYRTGLLLLSERIAKSPSVLWKL